MGKKRKECSGHKNEEMVRCYLRIRREKLKKKGRNMIRERKTEGRQNNSAGEDREAHAVGKDLLKMLLGLQGS